MVHKIEIYFLIYIIYSVVGYLIEVACRLVEDKRFVNRGFLIGPYCPIYGTGALLLTFFLEPFKYNIVLVFVLSMLICGILEYLTSYTMEKLFKARWWDYSNKKFNINGRICLKTIIPFGLLGTVILYITNPLIVELSGKLNIYILSILSGLIFVAYLIDNIISFRVILKFGQIASDVKVDNTEEISLKVKQVIHEQKLKLQERLVNAFPNFEPSIELINKKKQEIINRAVEIKENIGQKLDKVGDNITEKIDKINETLDENIVNIKKSVEQNVKRKKEGKNNDRVNKKI